MNAGSSNAGNASHAGNAGNAGHAGSAVTLASCLQIFQFPLSKMLQSDAV